MIKIERKEGVVFVNEKEIISCEHNKKRKEVYISRSDGSTAFRHVESVMYSNKSDTEWIEDGSEVAKLKEKIKQQEKSCSRLWRGMHRETEKIEMYERFKYAALCLLRNNGMPEHIVDKLEADLEETEKKWDKIDRDCENDEK